MTDIKAQVEKVQIEDGDILVINHPDPLPRYAVEYITKEARALLNRLGVRAEVMVLTDEMSAGLLKTSQINAMDAPNGGDQS